MLLQGCDVLSIVIFKGVTTSIALVLAGYALILLLSRDTKAYLYALLSNLISILYAVTLPSSKAVGSIITASLLGILNFWLFLKTNKSYDSWKSRLESKAFIKKNKRGDGDC